MEHNQRHPDASPEGRSMSPRGALPDLSGSHILFVDDEPILRRLAQTFLGSLHAEVATIASPFGALRRIESERYRPDILITDYSMPGLNGDELCALARRLMPELPVVIISATVCRAEIERLRSIPDSRFLSKPFSLCGLAGEVETLVAGRSRNAAYTSVSRQSP